MNDSIQYSTHEQNIREWLTEYKSLPKTSIEDYAAKVKEKHELLKSFHIAFNCNQPILLELVQPICHQLFQFYRSRNSELGLFALSAFPSLVGAYLKNCNSNVDESSQLSLSMGTFLLSVYNLLCSDAEISTGHTLYSENGVEVPNVVHSSVYHNSMAYPFSERTLSMPKLSSTTMAAKLPAPSYCSSILPSNRSKIMYTIMSKYLNNISFLLPSSYNYVCQICLNIASYGFPWHQMMLKSERSKADRRVLVTPGFSIVVVRCVYYALYNGYRAEAMKALQAMQKRSRYEVWQQVLLLCNGILNSANHEKSLNMSNAPYGLSTISTPFTRSSSKMLKNAVTAKSIKQHKWQHANEEVSGDYTESLIPEARLETIPSAMFDPDEARDPSTLSPAKFLKSKLKKNTPFPSTNSPGEKPRSLALSSGERKVKKGIDNNKSGDDGHTEERSRTPSGGQTVDSHMKLAKIPTITVSSKRPSTDDGVKPSSERSNSISRATDGTEAADPLLPSRLSEGSSSVSTVSSSTRKSNKSKNKQSNKSKNSEAKELLKSSSKSKIDDSVHGHAEGVPLLDDSRKHSMDEQSITTTL